MIRTERIWLKYNKRVSELCHIAKNLYNEANYLIRQELANNKKWIRYYELCRKLKNSENYRKLPAKTAQHVLQNLDKEWKSFFKSIKDWKKHPERYYSMPKTPRYLKKSGEYVLRFDYQQVKIKDGNLKFPKKTGIREVKVRKEIENLKEVRIVPRGVGYWLEIVYEKETYARKLNQDSIIAIDVGLRNLVAIVDNISGKPIVIKGGVMKSINQYYNKRKALLQSIYDKQKLKHTPKRIKKMSEKRMNRIRDYMHKTTRWIINYCIENNIGTIVIGHNKNWKQNVNLGKKNNQSFVSIPFNLLIQQLKYKAEEVGIKVITIDEAYTSKCSFLDNETIEYHDKYIGKRISRGLFRASDEIIINADVNGAYNILRKAIPNAFANGIEGVGLHPVRVNPLSQTEVVT